MVTTDPEDGVDRDVLINTKYENAMARAVQFLSVFFKKCGSKSEENFLQDLLVTVNTPEWPAAELLLSFLGKILVSQFANNSSEVSLRISSLDHLGELQVNYVKAQFSPSSSWTQSTRCGSRRVRTAWSQGETRCWRMRRRGQGSSRGYSSTISR